MNEEHFRNIAAECSAHSLVIEMMLAAVFALAPQDKESFMKKILSSAEHINPTWTGRDLVEQELFLDVHRRTQQVIAQIVQNASDMADSHGQT